MPRCFVAGKSSLVSWELILAKTNNKKKRFKLVPRNPNCIFSSTVTERIDLKLEANTFNVGIHLN